MSSSPEDGNTIRSGAESYVSFVGRSYLWPIATLVESLHARDRSSPDEVQASILDNGYSAAAVILIAVMLESFCWRGVFLDRSPTEDKAHQFLRRVLPAVAWRRARELFVVRDVLAHNHRWEGEVTYDGDGTARFTSVELAYGGDNKFRDSADFATRKTKLLALNIIPNKVCSADVTIALRETSTVLGALEDHDSRIVQLRDLHVWYRGEGVSFSDWVKML